MYRVIICGKLVPSIRFVCHDIYLKYTSQSPMTKSWTFSTVNLTSPRASVSGVINFWLIYIYILMWYYHRANELEEVLFIVLNLESEDRWSQWSLFEVSLRQSCLDRSDSLSSSFVAFWTWRASTQNKQIKFKLSISSCQPEKILKKGFGICKTSWSSLTILASLR